MLVETAGGVVCVSLGIFLWGVASFGGMAPLAVSLWGFFTAEEENTHISESLTSYSMTLPGIPPA